jgi:hypothetical protein
MCRCALSAAWVAALHPLVDVIERSWFFILIGVWNGVGSVVGVYVLQSRERMWREERQELNLETCEGD